MAARQITLTDPERKILEWFAAPEQDGYQVNTWAIPSELASFTIGADLQSLKRRGLLGAEGRGNSRQWWITDEGKAAIA